MGAKKFFLIGFILVILAAIPLTLFLVKQQQTPQSNAAPATVISLLPDQQTTPTSQQNPMSVGTNSNFRLDVSLNPGSNLVNYVKLVIHYDPTKFTITGQRFTPNSLAFPTVISGPTYDTSSGSIATITAELSIGNSATGLITQTVQVGTLDFQAQGAQSPTTPSVWIDDTQTIVNTSCPTQDLTSCNNQQGNEAANVLSSTVPAWIVTASGPTATPTIGPSPTPGPTSTVAAPACTSFTMDRATTGNAPFSIAFTATGNSDPSTTIQKITFNFGDGPIQQIISGGGIGTRIVSYQLSHTYNNPSTYTATATLTDGNGQTSDPKTCTQTITVNAAPTGAPIAQGPTSTPAATQIPTQIPTGIPTNIPTPLPTSVTVTPQGPGDTFIEIGAAGGILSIVGAAIFFLAL